MTAVIDASVLRAWLQDEPGTDAAEPLLMEGLIGAGELDRGPSEGGIGPTLEVRSSKSMSPEGSWEKSSAASVERFDAALPDHPALERRKMFGYAACFVNGHYCTGLYQDRFVIRLPGDIRNRFPELADAVPFDPMGNGKGMKHWYEIPDGIVADDARLADLLAATVDEVALLPPKAPKTAR